MKLTVRSFLSRCSENVIIQYKIACYFLIFSSNFWNAFSVASFASFLLLNLKKNYFQRQYWTNLAIISYRLINTLNKIKHEIPLEFWNKEYLLQNSDYLYRYAKASSEPCQIFKMDCFKKKVNGLKHFVINSYWFSFQ